MDYLFSTLRILQVAFGIGLVIFVHEAGHYIAARLCRVRVDVFSLGFGPRLLAWRRGPTTYQIALVPFGGYVKMAGEDPSERDRSARPDELAAKSPLQRFFIYSGGVLMNMVFALVVLPLVLLAGVPSSTPLIGAPVKGGPAWHARLETGTLFHSINGTPVYDFSDIAQEIALSGSDSARIELTRPGSAERESVTIQPEYDPEEGLYLIGVSPGADPELELVVAPDSPAAAAGMLEGDRLLGVDGQPRSLPPDRQLFSAFAGGAPIALRYERAGEEREALIEPRLPEEDQPKLLGLQPGRLVIRDVRAGGLAAELGFEAGDGLLSIGGRAVYTTNEVLPALLAVSGPARFALERKGRSLEIQTPVLDEAAAVALEEDLAIEPDSESRVLAVVPHSPAEEAGIRAGDRLHALDGDAVESYSDFLERTKSSRKSGTAVTIELQRTGSEGESELHEVTLAPRRVPFPEYGLGLRRAQYIWHVPSVGGAIAAGYASSLRFASSVWHMLRKMGSGEVSSRNMGGPILIAVVSDSVAHEGWAKLFFFLCILSINLAFLNVLPIPVLDGGHLFFILVEMIKGSPVSERTLGYSQIVGLVLIVSLMVYVTYNDVMRFFWRS